MLLGDPAHIEEGQLVKRTGNVLSVPVGDGFLGRVVNPLGAPIDGLGPIEPEDIRALEVQAPNVVQRQPVTEPMLTGLKAVDSMTAIGRGQRQLIIGDRQTGKTALALDTILNQKENWDSGDPAKQVKCVYVAIGQKGSTIAAVRGALEANGALEYTTIVAAPASDNPGFKYLAPTPVPPSGSTGCTTARQFSLCLMTCRSRPRPTVQCHCYFVAHRVARRTQVTSSTCTRGSSSVARSSQKKWAAVR